VVASYQSLRFFYKCARHKPSLFNVIQISLWRYLYFEHNAYFY
jgi:hypothetical protein